MSKSEGNFYTLRDLLEKGYDPRAIRLELLKTHYRQQLDFREDNLEGNRKIVDRLDECRQLLSEDAETGEGVESWKTVCEEAEQQFISAMDDDLNISGGLAAILGFVKEVNKSAEHLSAENKKVALSLLDRFDSVLGLHREQEEDLLEEEIQALIDERSLARKNKDFARADEIRDELLAKGIELKDTPDGVKYRRLQ